MYFSKKIVYLDMAVLVGRNKKTKWWNYYVLIEFYYNK